MQFESSASKHTSLPANFNRDTEPATPTAHGMVKELAVLGPQPVGRGFAPNLFEQLTNTTKAWRDDVDKGAIGRHSALATVSVSEWP
ncbi:MAG TPA: hypothetical protein VHQ23_14580, partial [Ilumatobacteraceae bacterium]|nr:hypothetical protein [Ilumatobacteraceae bacterium]